MVMAPYLKERASYKPLVQPPVLDAYGEPAYQVSRTVKVRKEAKFQEVQDSRGALVKSSYTYYMSQPVEVGDLLDGKPVIACLPYTGYSGKSYGYEVLL